MAKLPYNWNKVSPGDFISFVYENKEGKKLRRTILVLDPKLRNRAKNPSSQYLVHGIQLEVSNQPTLIQMKTLLEQAGTTEIVDEKKKIYRVQLDGTAKQIYKKMKALKNQKLLLQLPLQVWQVLLKLFQVLKLLKKKVAQRKLILLLI